ncbi:MAG: hypothetical protein OER86_02595, partial [Phycisphaerae bacterium]|nr:hypothetical protein [Phycisphaerae bacterium]
SRVSREVAEELMRRLPNSEDARAALVESGQQLALRMGWDRVVEQALVPMLQRVQNEEPVPQLA